MSTATISIKSIPADKQVKFYDIYLLLITFTLLGFSLIMVYSTTGVVSSERFGDPNYYLKRQLISALAGIVLMFALAQLNVSFLRKLSVFCLPLSIFLLLLTLTPGISEAAGGARRWVNLGIIRFQPAEVVKLLFVIFIAGYISRHENRLAEFRAGVIKPFVLVCLISGLLLLQPDFGSAAVIAIVVFSMVAVSGVRLLHMFLCAGAFISSCGILIFLSPYRMKRVVSFMSPWADPSGSGYQLIQSLIAVGSGQLGGVGLGASQQKLFFLPAAHTDFIFAVIAEELGFVGCLAVIALFLLFLWRGLHLAGRMSNDSFAFSLASGLTLLIVLPALLNIGVVIGMLPTKGLVLPLIGFGGTSLVTTLAAVGVLLALARSDRA